MDFGVATVAAITALVYIIGLGVRATPLDNKWIPVICGVCGFGRGILALGLGGPDLPATGYLTAAAVGGASGLAATGLNQMVKQMGKQNT